MGDQTEEPKSSGPHDGHVNAELSKGTCSAESATLRPARALKSEFPWRPTKGGVGIRRTKRIVPACLSWLR